MFFDVWNGLQALWCLLSGKISRGAWVGQKCLVKFVKVRKSRFESISLIPCLMRSWTIFIDFKNYAFILYKCSEKGVSA